MAEAFPQSDSFETRKGNVIRRHGTHHEKRTISEDPVALYIEKYGDPRVGTRKDRGRVEETGRMFEYILGAPDVEAINKAALNEHVAYEVEGFGGKKFLSLQAFKKGHWGDVDEKKLRRCFELVKQHQGPGNNPENPTHFFPRSLREKIMHSLGVSLEEGSRVKYFVSAKTPLDYTPAIGADAFLEIDGNIITIDVSEKDSKERHANHADVMITERDVSMLHELNPSVEGKQRELAERAYETQIEAIAKEICAIYELRMEKAA